MVGEVGQLLQESLMVSVAASTTWMSKPVT
jgi:hypothetical protein